MPAVDVPAVDVVDDESEFDELDVLDESDDAVLEPADDDPLEDEPPRESVL